MKSFPDPNFFGEGRIFNNLIFFLRGVTRAGPGPSCKSTGPSLAQPHRELEYMTSKDLSVSEYLIFSDVENRKHVKVNIKMMSTIGS